MRARRMHVVTKWDKWLNNQNDATKAYFEAQAKEDNKFITAIAVPTFVLGVVVGILIGVSI